MVLSKKISLMEMMNILRSNFMKLPGNLDASNSSSIGIYSPMVLLLMLVKEGTNYQEGKNKESPLQELC